MTKRAIGYAALLMLGGCDQLLAPEAEVKGPAARLPAQVCAQAQEALQKLTATAGFDQRAKGEATLEEAAWLQMTEAQRDQLAKVLAYDAACAAKEPPHEQVVTVKNETGRVMAQRTIETSADLSSILDE